MSGTVPTGLYPSSKITQYRTVDWGDPLELTRSLKSIRDAKVIGVAICFGKAHLLSAIALSTRSQALLINVSSKKGSTGATKCRTLLTEFFYDQDITFVGFEMARIALRIFHQLKVYVRGVDLIHYFNRYKSAGELVTHLIAPEADGYAIENLWDPSVTSNLSGSLRAWIACLLGIEQSFESTAKVDTSCLPNEQILCLGNMQLQKDRLHSAKPLTAKGEFSGIQQTHDSISIINSRYRTKIRSHSQQTVVLTDSNGRQIIGKAISLNGRTTKVAATGRIGDVKEIQVKGREDLTNSDLNQNQFVLRVLHGKINMLDSPFIRCVWFPRLSLLDSNEDTSVHPLEARWTAQLLAELDLNSSQRAVARAMLDVSQPTVMTHGPPGTGKTRTIAAAVGAWTNGRHRRRCAWLVAQSNVGVKNIAETLIKTESTNFRLIVSKDFHFEWHEHIYNKVDDFLIRADELPDGLNEIRGLFQNVDIILCTLSTLSNPKLNQCRLFDFVPVDMLVIDEASQIYSADYMHVFYRFRNTLRKVCWFGDPEQLPPYQKDQISGLTSIFDMKHLEKDSHFLDTQYRMPSRIGDFISRAVYMSKLKSVHGIQDMTCLTFIDVSKGEEERVGTSWRNTEEVHTIGRLVQDYYQHKHFVIITPYDPQREAIEKMLKSSNLPWEGKVFNLDSFQGNEADYVLISIVRTTKPGFLTSKNRMNVMLTRCKRGMVIVTNRNFFRSMSGAQHTLVGKLAKEWEMKRQSDPWVDWRLVAEGKAPLPGVSPPRASIPPAPPMLKSTPTAVRPLPKSMPSTRASTGASQARAQMHFPPLPTLQAPSSKSKNKTRSDLDNIARGSLATGKGLRNDRTWIGSGVRGRPVWP